MACPSSPRDNDAPAIPVADATFELDERLGLDLVMPDYDERMAVVARNISRQKIALAQAVARPREGV